MGDNGNKGSKSQFVDLIFSMYGSNNNKKKQKFKATTIWTNNSIKWHNFDNNKNIEQQMYKATAI